MTYVITLFLYSISAGFINIVKYKIIYIAGPISPNCTLEKYLVITYIACTYSFGGKMKAQEVVAVAWIPLPQYKIWRIVEILIQMWL